MHVASQVMRLVAAALLLCATALTVRRRVSSPPAVALRLLDAALVLNVLLVALRAYQVRFVPLGTGRDVLLALSLMVLAAYRVRPSILGGARPAPVVFCLSAVFVAAGILGGPGGRLPDPVRSVMLLVHVPGAVAAYACFTLNAVVCVWLAVVARGCESGEDDGALQKGILLARRLALTGWALYGVFIMLGGMVWARLAWGRYWGWDPKETLSLAAFCVCSLYVYFEVVIRPRSRTFLAALSGAGFLTLALTFVFGMLVRGLHGHS